MRKIACIMMQKDERFLLTPWLAYHGHLFGFDNLYVLDNGSALSEVRSMLLEYAGKGVRIIWDFASRQDYLAKGELIGALIRTLDATHEYDFLIPLDCDEFVVLRTEKEFECSREAILSYIASLIGENRTLRFPYQLANHPLHTDIYHPFEFFKVFFGSGTFSPMDHGHHIAKFRETRDTRLVHLHFHYKIFEMKVEQARQSWVGLIDPNNLSELDRYVGPSAHLKRYFLTDREQYYRSFRNKVHFFLPQFRALLHDLGAPLELPIGFVPEKFQVQIIGVDDLLGPNDNGGVVLIPNNSGANPAAMTEPERFRAVRFNERLYLAANPSLVAAGVDPTIHFSDYGFKEN